MFLRIHFVYEVAVGSDVVSLKNKLSIYENVLLNRSATLISNFNFLYKNFYPYVYMQEIIY